MLSSNLVRRKAFSNQNGKKQNKLISEKQSRFKPGDSCVNQSLAITHEIFSSFDDNYGVREVFLVISKPFVKVCREGIIHKLRRNGIS